MVRWPHCVTDRTPLPDLVQVRKHLGLTPYQPAVPGPPLNGPTTSGVTQPP
jgi:hypothetical protein